MEKTTMVSLRCTKCGAKLESALEKLTCPACGTSWPVIGGIPRFFRSEEHYWGEIGRAEARALLAAARQTSWVEAARSTFPGWEMQISLLDPQRASWQFMLGLDSDAVALDIGSGYGAITHSLARTMGEVYSVEAIPERIEFTQTRLEQEQISNVQLIQASLTALPFFEGTFDLVVANGILEWVGEWDLDDHPRTTQLRFLSTARKLLRDNGVMVIGIENRIGYNNFLGTVDHSGIPYTSLLPRRLATFYLQHNRSRHHRTTLNPKREYRTYTYSARGCRKLLAEAGFEDVSFYWADPGYNQPYNLIPLSSLELIREHFLENLGHPGTTGASRWRRRMARAALSLGFMPWVVPEFLIVASKSLYRNTKLHQWLREQLHGHAADKDRPVNVEKLHFVSHMQAFKPKGNLRLWNPNASRVEAVAKVEVAVPDHTSGVETEFANLRRVSERLRSGLEPSIAVPSPMGTLRIGNSLYCLESAASGTKLSRTLRRPGYFDSLGNVKKDFELIATRTVELSAALRELRSVKPIEATWYEIPGELRSARETQAQIERMRYFKGGSGHGLESWVQHGDLSVENVFLDRKNRRIEVIDWATLAAGFPPLYDLFSLILSTGYLARAGERMRFSTPEDYWRASFRNIFFERTGFGEIVRNLLVDASQQLALREDLIPSLLVEFLLIRVQYYHAFKSREAQIHTELLRFCVSQEARPVIGGFWPGAQGS